MQITRSGWRLALSAVLLTTLLEGTLAAPPAPASAAYPGPIAIQVDATNIRQWIFEIHETIPVRPGPLRLLYPRWLPGDHGPYGDTNWIGGLTIQAGGQRLAWSRTTADLNAFDLQIPPQVTSIDANFQWLGSTKSAYPPPMSKDMLGIQWTAMVLYPAGYAVSAIEMHPSVKLPAGFQWGSALRQRAKQGDWIELEPVSLETLADSPFYAGASYRRVELDPPGSAQAVRLHLFADSQGSTSANDEQIDAHRRVIEQADRLFGHRPWKQYDLLLANGKGIRPTALEHQASSENAYDGHYFDDWNASSRRRDDLAHELIHAWNGKFRRPADLWAADMNTPTGNSLLWVYEGLTEYWGMVIAARSGLINDAQAHKLFGDAVAAYQTLPGRAWRSLQDTTNEPGMASSNASPWRSWSRGEDYYDEAALLIWLDADTLIRERSAGHLSLDDFARRFFGQSSVQPGPDLYTFDDVVAAMNAVYPNDWRGFFRERLDRTVVQVPLDGLTRAGWRLDYRDARSALDLSSLNPDKPVLTLRNSLGLTIGGDGEIVAVTWDSPAFREGLAAGDKIVAVNFQSYTADRIEAALVANKSGAKPLALWVRRDDDFRVVGFDLRTGPRYPALVRLDGVPDRLADIFRAR